MTACEVAGRFDVTGYVRNLADGRVEMIAEGDGETVDAFIAAVERAMGGLIDHTDSTARAATGGFEGFRISY